MASDARPSGENMIRYFIVPLFLHCTFGLCEAEVRFDFTYFDIQTNTGLGFDDPVLGSDRVAALEAVAADIGSQIGQTATVEIGIAPSESDGSGFLATAGAEFIDTTPGFRDGEVYRRIVLGETDTTPDVLDGGMVFDFGYALSLSGMPEPDEVYFPDLARHEITHLLGFGSFIRVDGTGFHGTAPDMYSRFDSMVTAGPSGQSVLAEDGTLALNPIVYGVSASFGFLFDGPATREANDGAALRLFAFAPSHTAREEEVMFPSPAKGYVRDDWTDVEKAVLRDLGYTIGAMLDCNGDGVVDANDLSCACGSELKDELLDELGIVAGDLDANGSVDFLDFLRLAQNFGGSGEYVDGDIDCSGQVSFLDFLTLAQNFGQQSNATISNVPEVDTTGVLFLLFCCMALVRRKARR